MKIRFLLVSIFFITIPAIMNATSNPNTSRVYGDQFIAGVSQNQSAATIGTIDTNFASGGYQELNAQLTPSSAVAIQALPDGTFLAVLQGSTSTAVAKYNAEGTIQTYGTSGVATLGLTTVQASMLDVQGRLLVAGNTSGTPYIQRVIATGASVSSFTGGTWSSVAGLAQQTTGKIIAVGFNGTHGQIARYTDGTATVAGSLDTSATSPNIPFNGGTGVIVFDGTNGITSTTGLYNVVVDATNNIYVAYCDSGNSGNLYVAKFLVDGTFVSTTHLTYFDGGATASQVRMAMDMNGNLVVAAQVGTSILVSAQILTAGSFANTTVSGTYTLNLGALVTTSNGEILLVGNDTDSSSHYSQRITCLTSTGGLNTSFYPSQGYNEFSATTPNAAATLYAAAIADDGQIYAVGYESSGTSQPYVYRLNNYQYVSSVAQFPAATQEQGIVDLSFGNTSYQTYPGVETVINGLYGAVLKQQAVTAIEVLHGAVTAGDIVVGSNGLTDTKYVYDSTENAYSNMMFSYLTQAGDIDTTAGFNGFVTLQNVSGSNEYMTSMVQDNVGNVYVSGYTSTSTTPTAPGNGANTSAIMRVYSIATAGNAEIAVSQAGSGWQGVGISLQTRRTLLCVAQSITVGHITSYISQFVDLSFGDSASGTINPTSYGLNMGPCYGIVVNSSNNIFAAYVENGTSQVDVVKFLPDGSGLASGFGSHSVSGGTIVSNIFSGYTVDPSNVRIGLMESGDIVVAAVSPTYILVATFNASSGATTMTTLETPITGSTSLHITRVTGVSDGSIILTLWDNAADDTMYLARIVGGVLDTTFNSQGSQQGVLPVQVGANYTTRSATCALVQSTTGPNKGNIVMIGNESLSTNDSTSMVMRVYGAPDTTEVLDYQPSIIGPGMLETSYDLATSPLVSFGTGNAIFVYPSGNVHAGKILVAIDGPLVIAGPTTVEASLVARLDQATMKLDTTFGSYVSGTSGPQTGVVYMYGYGSTTNLTGISSINIDAANNVLVGGYDTGLTSGWAQAIADNGLSSTVFDMSGLTNLNEIHGIYQQNSGRYIIAASGTDLSSAQVNLLVAFQDQLVATNTPPYNLKFQQDFTFNPLSATNIAAGSYSLGAVTGGLYSMAINTDDTIAVAYANNASPKKIVVTSITADGSGPNLNFNSGTAITTTISADSSAVVQLNIDGSGNVIVGASYNVGVNQVQVSRYSPAGVLDTGGFGSSGIATISNLGTAGVTLTSLMETSTGQTVLTGYNSAGVYGNLFAARLDAAGVLDTTWNTDYTSPDSFGVLTYEVFSAININDAAIGNNGTILSIGSTTGSYTTSSPIVSFVYGDSDVTQVAQNPLQAAAGTKDSTIAGNVSGALPLASLPVGPSITGVPAKIYIYNSTVPNTSPYISPNGAMLVASTSGGTVYVTQLNSDLSINTTHFGASGVVMLTPNSTSSPTSATVTDMYLATDNNVAAQQYIYVVGYTTVSATNSPFIARITPNGLSSIISSPAAVLPTTGCVRQSSNSRILISGSNGSSGAIVAYNSTLTAIDTSFGNNDDVAPLYGTGYYATGINKPILAMAIDNLDRIYIAYQISSSLVVVQRLLENGTALDLSFNSAGTPGTYSITGTSLSATQIKMAVDFTNNQLVVAMQSSQSSGNSIQVQRLILSTGVAAGNLTQVVATGAIFNLADLFIDNNQDIYIAGSLDLASTAGPGNSVIIRLTSTSSTTIALDTTYGPYVSGSSGPQTGIANFPEGAMTIVTAAALHPDRRVYMVGSNTGVTAGYMGRFYGDYYWTQDSQATAQAIVGTVDPTLNPNNLASQNGINLSTLTGWSTLATNNYQALAITENPNGDGSSFIAFGNGTNLTVGHVNADMVPISAFNSSGLTTPIAMSTVNSMIVDASGNVIVSGAQSGSQLVVSFTSAGIQNATFGTFVYSSAYGKTVVQQKSGRYLVAGYIAVGSYSVISAYQNESAISSSILPIDPTFGPEGDSGYRILNIPACDDMIVDSQDYIYAVSRSSGVIVVAKVTANGSGLVTSQNSPVAFNSGNVLTTDITAYGSNQACIAINGTNNILIGATTSSGVQVHLYDQNGASLNSAVTLISGTNYILTQLVGSVGSKNEFYASVYNTSTNQALTFAITSAGIADTAFNAYNAITNPTGTTNGSVVTSVQSPVQINGLAVQSDGKIVMVGYTTSGTNQPVLVRSYGSPYVSQYPQYPDAVEAGILDTTLWPTTGALELDTYYPIANGITSLASSRAKRLYEYSNGNALFLLDNTGSSNNATTLIAAYQDLTLNTSFNVYNATTNPTGTAGYITIPSVTNATTLFVSSLTDIFIAGGTTTSWIRAYNNDGTPKGGWTTPTVNMSAAYQLSIQSTQRVILAGQDGTGGVLYAYKPSGGTTLDLSFGTGNGKAYSGYSSPITDITIDSSDSIICVTNNSGTVALQRISQSGGIVTPLNGGTAITNAIGNPKVILDQSGHIVVASATSSGPIGFTLRRYNNNTTGTDNAGPVTISVGSGTPFLGNIYATNDGKVVLVGSEPTAGVVAARLTSAFALDTGTFNSPLGYSITSAGSANVIYDGIICADDRIMLAGTHSGTPEPYLARVFGDTYVSYVVQGPVQGIAGTINLGFGTNGTLTYGTGTTGILSDAQGKAIFPLSNGRYYQVFDLANPNISGVAQNSVLIKTLADGSLDTSYNTSGTQSGIAGNGTSTYAPLGVNSILQDGVGKVLLVGTTAGAGWLQRYTTSGALDNTANSGALAFNSTGIVNLASGTVTTVAIEQTLARYIVAGANSSGAMLFAYKSLAPTGASGIPGSVDTTFNAGAGGTPGYIQIVDPNHLVSGSPKINTNTVYNLIADQYDRLIFAVLNNTTGNTVDLYRMTPTGELDVTFGGNSNGVVADALTSIANATDIRVALDAAGNIIVAATSSTTNTFSVAAYDNLTSASSGANGVAIYSQLNINSLTNGPKVTALVTSADGYALILGTQTAPHAAWIARITNIGELDIYGFNPLAVGGIAGIFQYTGAGTIAHIYNGLAVNANGTLAMLGYEVTHPSSVDVYTPTLVSIYDDPYTSQELQTPDSKPTGTIDATVGVGVISSAVTAVANGTIFYGAGGSAGSGQRAEAVGLYDDNNIVVAIDGGTNSAIIMNMFDTDGLFNPNFNSGGTATVSLPYQNQYVNDMVTFTGIDGVTRAILAGYTYNSTLPSAYQYSSLLLQYDLRPTVHSLDSGFGGRNGNPYGVAFGDGKQLFTVSQQSTGRIITSGLSKDTTPKGLLLGYTATGKLDLSFGANGYQSVNTGTTGLYTHAIDSQNRIVIAYNNGSNSVAVARFLADGSGLDPNFTISGSLPNIPNLLSNTNIKVAVGIMDYVTVAAVVSPGNQIDVASYTNTGALIGTIATFPYSFLGGSSSSSYTLTKTIVDAAGNVIVVAYDTYAQQTLVMRLTSALALDTTFNSAGYITYQVGGESVTSQLATDSIIHPDGRIIVIGSES